MSHAQHTKQNKKKKELFLWGPENYHSHLIKRLISCSCLWNTRFKECFFEGAPLPPKTKEKPRQIPKKGFVYDKALGWGTLKIRGLTTR
jgi:hypothetical protein